MKYTSLTALLFASLVACDGGSESTSSSELSGTATYHDAETDHDGTTRAPAEPPAQEASVTMVVRGTGEIPNLDPQCATDPLGAFEARYASEASLAAEEGYVAAFGSSAAEIATPSGCEIPELTVGLVTDIVIRAELATTTQNCETYCAADARAQAEAQCGASPTAAQCRSAAEADFAAQCTTTCTTRASTIVAETSLGVGALGTLDFEKLRAAAFGEITADLTFDRMEDADGNAIGN